MSVFIDAYARLIYFLCRFLIRCIYRQPTVASFSAKKHTKMVNLSLYLYKVFNLVLMVVSKKTRHNYTMAVNYEGCKLLIRPFIIIEIVMVSGLWEIYMKPILDKELKSSDVIVDVGANIGVYTIPLARRTSKVIAFEPHPKTSEMLEKSI